MMKRVSCISLFLAVFLLTTLSLTSQELDVRLTVNHENLPSSHRDFLEQNFNEKVLDYLSRRWTNEDFGNDRIPVEISIFFRSATPDYRYMAQIFIGSSRPIYNTDRNTITARLLDDNWEFSFPPGKTLRLDEFTFDGLATLLDFYAYLIIGLDFDTFEPLAGNIYLERAANLARLAQQSGGRGWDRAPTGYSRLTYVEDLLSSRNRRVREAVFHYHYNGLDLLEIDRGRALESIVETIDILAAIRRDDPRNLPVQIFFDTKYSEISEVLLDYHDRSIYDRLSSIDPSHRSTYEEYRRK